MGIIAWLFSDARNRSRTRTVGIYALLIEANVIGWIWALAVVHGHPALLGTAFLAYTLGLRHAFDADHIVAIDNVTRKLIQQGKRPVAAALFFARTFNRCCRALRRDRTGDRCASKSIRSV